ncbi:hypothetical protein [Synechococcus sp. RS9916]|uniref:hypothetical protein n=1 Tax=Synechococcus sp. RS9916 TaxID=221359 RepID=UPI0000E53D8D|nr:hypothetical protein [Synechococcus sp. RS9916]EAU73028.1 hypothetical protein RS9916_25994 [Synechococcus sp. RS9916]
MLMEPIQKGLEQSFESERLKRWIRECQEIEELREAALVLVQQLDQQKSARAWLAARASDSENAKLNMLAELIKRTGQQGESSDAPKEDQDSV